MHPLRTIKIKKEVMNEKEKAFLNLAIKYKEKYDSCPWWKFSKRRKIKKSWNSAIELMIRFSN